MLRQNLGYKILALLLAVFLWFWVTITQRNAVATQPATVRVEMRNQGKRVVAAVEPERVRLILRGRPDALQSPLPPPQAWVDLRHAQFGRHRAKVFPIVPVGVRLVRIEPTHVQLTLEPIITKAMKVEANVIGVAPAGYVLGQPQVSPATVTVSGVPAAIAQVGHVAVNVDAASARPDLVQTNILRAVDNSGEEVEGVTLSRSQARIVLPVERVLSYQTEPVVVRTDGAPAPGYRITEVSARPAVVTIAGEAQRLQQVDHVRTAMVNIDGATADINRVVALVLPDGVTTVSDSRVQVSIHIEPLSRSESSGNPPRPG